MNQQLIALLHWVMPPVKKNKKLTLKDWTVWGFEIAMRLFILWFFFSVLNVRFSIGG